MPRKTPKKNASLQARTSVTSRTSSMDSPDWKPANEFSFSFKSPKSPSPVKRTTRRSSVYKFTATSNTSSAKVRMPTGIKSPPGTKTRARRSSIYQKSATQITSPPSSRTRRRSMYVSAKPGLQPLKEFSKVWATPIKSIEAVSVKSPEKMTSPLKSKAKKSPKNTPVVRAVKTGSAASKTPKSLSGVPEKTPTPEPKKTPAKSTTKTPKTTKGSTKKSPAKSTRKQSHKNKNEDVKLNTPTARSASTPISKRKTAKVVISPIRPVKIDLAISETKKTPKPTSNKLEKVTPQEIKPKKTPARSSTKKTPASKKSPDLEISQTKKTPKSTRNKLEKITPQEIKPKKTPARSNTKKSPASKKSANSASSLSHKKKPMPMNKNTPKPVAKSASTPIIQSQKPASTSSVSKTKSKKSPKSTAGMKSTPRKAKSEIFTSTPSKSIEEISGKSFYSTPKETPVPSIRQEVKSVASARSTKKTSVKRAVIMSPQITPHRRTMKTPKKTPLPKSASTRKRARNDSAGTLPPSKRVKKTPTTLSIKSAKRPSKKMAAEPDSLSPSKTVLTPSEMTSILMDVVETERKEKRERSFSPSPRLGKRARLAEDVAELSTPRLMKEAKRKTSRKLTEIHENQSSSTVMSRSGFLDETINTDSRSGRCTIL